MADITSSPPLAHFQPPLPSAFIMPTETASTAYDDLPPWSCGVCTFENAKSVTNCRVCEIGERPAHYGTALLQKSVVMPIEMVPAPAPVQEPMSSASATATPDPSPALTEAPPAPVTEAPPAPVTEAPPLSAAKGEKAKAAKKPARVRPPRSLPPPREPRSKRNAARKALNNINNYMGVSNSHDVAPSASHYVGYVEEGETVDMIMAKFQMMEEVLKKQTPGNEGGGGGGDSPATETGDPSSTVSTGSKAAKGAAGSATGGGSGGLSEEQLEEIFRCTSNFTVAGASRAMEADDMAAMAGIGAHDIGWENAAELLELDAEDEGQYFWSGNVDENDFWDDMYEGKKPNKKRRRKEKVAKEKRARARKPGKPRRQRVDRGDRLPGELGHGSGITNIAFVSDARGHFITALKRVRKYVDPKAIVYTRIPYLKVEDRKYPDDPPCPLSWAKRIKTYVPPAIRAASKVDPIQPDPELKKHYYKVPEIIELDLETLLPTPEDPDFNFIGITMNPSWRPDSVAPDDPVAKGTIVPEDLKRLNLSRKVLPTGIVFVWVKKTQIGRVISALETHDLYYVENLCWVKEQTSNTFVESQSPYFRETHETLLIFRRGHISPTGKHYHDKLELRHQRTEDVVFDFVTDKHSMPGKGRADGVDTKPDGFLQKLVERMLPRAFLTAGGEGKYPRGRLLELWASPWSKAKGWTTVVQG